jgi:hypothetical protein
MLSAEKDPLVTLAGRASLAISRLGSPLLSLSLEGSR